MVRTCVLLDWLFLLILSLEFDKWRVEFLIGKKSLQECQEDEGEGDAEGEEEGEGDAEEGDENWDEERDVEGEEDNY